MYPQEILDPNLNYYLREKDQLMSKLEAGHLPISIKPIPLEQFTTRHKSLRSHYKHLN